MAVVTGARHQIPASTPKAAARNTSAMAEPAATLLARAERSSVLAEPCCASSGGWKRGAH